LRVGPIAQDQPVARKGHLRPGESFPHGQKQNENAAGRRRFLFGSGDPDHSAADDPPLRNCRTPIAEDMKCDWEAFSPALLFKAAAGSTVLYVGTQELPRRRLAAGWTASRCWLDGEIGAQCDTALWETNAIAGKPRQHIGLWGVRGAVRAIPTFELRRGVFKTETGRRLAP